ncbi:MAG: trigger factor [Thiotrichales bacterium]|nr:MAG: trigger factor [Thiotrichales bacterium]
MNAVVTKGKSELERCLKVSVDFHKIEKAVKKQLEKASRNARIPGFRPGRVPLKVMQKHYGNGIRQDVLQDSVKTALHAALQDHKLRPATSPSVQITKDTPGEDMEFTANFEIYPQIKEIQGLDNLTVEKPVIKIDDKDVDAMLEDMCKKNLNWKTVERACKLQDRVNIDYELRQDGKSIENGATKKFNLVLGSGVMIPGFEDKLASCKTGKEKKFTLTFPAEYPEKEFANSKFDFLIKINKIEESSKPEVNEEFAKKLGMTDVKSLRTEVRKTMQLDLDAAIKIYQKQQVFRHISTANKTVQLPGSLVTSQEQLLKDQVVKKLGLKNSEELSDSFIEKSDFTGQASNSVLLRFIVEQFMQDFKLEVDTDEVRRRIEMTAGMFEDPQKAAKQYYNDPSMLSFVQSAVIEDQVVKKIVASAKTTEKTYKFTDFFELYRKNPNVKEVKKTKK